MKKVVLNLLSITTFLVILIFLFKSTLNIVLKIKYKNGNYDEKIGMIQSIPFSMKDYVAAYNLRQCFL